MFLKCSVTYLRLDGSVEPGRRFEIVKSFNSDPTIDVFLLTTHGNIILFWITILLFLPSTFSSISFFSWRAWFESYIS